MARRNSRTPGPNDIPLFEMPKGQVRSGVRRPNPQVRGVGTAKRTTPMPQVGHASDFASGETAKSEADRTMSDETATALAWARAGDDSMLLPYQPTPSINPPRPRTLAAGYDPATQTLRIRFRDGVGYEYYHVPPNVWRNFRRVKSPGRSVNRVLNNYSYSRADW